MELTTGATNTAQAGRSLRQPASGPSKAVTGAASGPRRHPSEGGPTGRQYENDSEANRNEKRHERRFGLSDSDITVQILLRISLVRVSPVKMYSLASVFKSGRLERKSCSSSDSQLVSE